MRKNRKIKIQYDKILSRTCLSMLVLLMLAMIFPIANTNAEVAEDDTPTTTEAGEHPILSVHLKPVISVALSSFVNIDAIPGNTGNFSSSTAQLTVGTNNTSGYKIFMNGINGTSLDLANDATGAKKINSITEDTLGDNLPRNTWGAYVGQAVADSSLGLQNETLKPISDTAEQIAATSDGEESTNTYSLGFGVNVDTNIPAGVYTRSVMVSVVANPLEVSTIMGLTYMQDMTPKVCEGSTIATAENEPFVSKQLIDTRDGKKYWVAKLADGNCWMTQNLALDLSTEKTLTPTDTDITEDYTPTMDMYAMVTSDSSPTADASWNLQNGGLWLYAYPNYSGGCAGKIGIGQTFSDLNCSNRYIDVSGPEWIADASYGIGTGVNYNVVDTVNHIYNPHYLIGNYYTYAAATAKTGNDITTGEAVGSICPKGWQLPSAGADKDNGSIANLLSKYNRTYANIADSPLYFVRSGQIGTTYTGLYMGQLGALKTSSAVGQSGDFILMFNGSTIFLPHSYTRANGFPVRCLAR